MPKNTTVQQTPTNHSTTWEENRAGVHVNKPNAPSPSPSQRPNTTNRLSTEGKVEVNSERNNIQP